MSVSARSKNYAFWVLSCFVFRKNWFPFLISQRPKYTKQSKFTSVKNVLTFLVPSLEKHFFGTPFASYPLAFYCIPRFLPLNKPSPHPHSSVCAHLRLCAVGRGTALRQDSLSGQNPCTHSLPCTSHSGPPAPSPLPTLSPLICSNSAGLLDYQLPHHQRLPKLVKPWFR